MNTAAYAEALERYVEELETGYGDIMMDNNITLGIIISPMYKTV